MTSPTVKVQNAGRADLIAYAWYELGYPPQDSLVLIGLHAPRLRLGVIARADLPGPHTSQRRFGELVRSLAEPLMRSGASSVVALICAPDGLRPPAALIRALSREPARLGLDLMDVLGVTADRYRSVRCQDRGCCPVEAQDLAEVLTTRAAASLVLAGYALHADEADLLADVLPGNPEPQAVPAASPGTAGAPGPVPLDAQDRLRWWGRWADALASLRDAGNERGNQAGALAEPADLEQLWSALHDVPLRDAVMLSALGAPGRWCEEQLASAGQGDVVISGADDGGGPNGAAVVPSALEGEPDRQVLATAQRWLATAARAAPAGRRAPVLAVLAVLSWFSGGGPRARLLASRALDDDPGYSLAQLVQELLVQAIPPPWAERQWTTPGG
jgi:Domain of unknown function (DUF4192)